MNTLIEITKEQVAKFAAAGITIHYSISIDDVQHSKSQHRIGDAYRDNSPKIRGDGKKRNMKGRLYPSHLIARLNPNYATILKSLPGKQNSIGEAVAMVLTDKDHRNGMIKRDLVKATASLMRMEKNHISATMTKLCRAGFVMVEET